MESFNLVKHRLGDAYRNAVSSVSAPSDKSKFVESGTLTPQEFIEAGDQLTFKFTTWSWTSGDEKKSHSFLPPEKQYLITRNVPCELRVKELGKVKEHSSEDGFIRLALEDEDDRPAGAAEELQDLDDLNGTAEASSSQPKGIIFDADEDFISSPKGNLPDFSDLDAQLQEDDDVPAFGGGGGYGGDSNYIVAQAPDAGIKKMRTYDLSITYDTYYLTPRLWLFGYSETGEPLTHEEVYEDISSDYVSKTVTIDPHPHTGTPTVSIHPCKHAQVMKRVVNEWIENGQGARHDLALFVFLKFISSVVPTITYDFTMEIEMFSPQQ